MSAILLLALCLGIGLAMARHERLPPGAPQALNFWIVNIALPALILVEIPKLHFSGELLFPAIAPWLVFLGAVLIFPIVGRRRGWSRGTIGAMVLTCGLGNTAYMGLAMVEALKGAAFVGPAVIADQFGSFAALSIGGVIVAAIYSGAPPSIGDIARRMLGFTPFLALMVALAIWPLGGLPEVLQTVLTRIGQTLTPLALFSVGLVFQFSALRGRVGLLAAGLGWKLVLAPAAALAVALAGGFTGQPALAGVLQAAQGPMITAGILAQEHRLDPPLVTLVVGCGILLSFVTAPLWYLLLR